MSRSLVVHTVPDQGMKTEEFAQAQAAASRVFGRDKEAGVIFQGDQAHVRKDGTIVYPALNDGQQMSKTEVMVARGFADHETAHKRYTDLGVVSKFVDHCKRTDNQLLRQVGNAVDDLRVDTLAIRDYSGAQANIESTTEAMMSEFTEFAKENPEDAADMDVVLPLMITAEGRRRMGFKSPSLDASLATLSEENRKKVNTLTDIAMQCTNPDKKAGTEEVVKIAKAVIAAKAEIDKEEEEKKPGSAPGEGSGEGEGKGEASGGKGDGDGDPSGKSKKHTPDAKPELAGGELADALRDQAMQKVFQRHTDSDDKKYRPFTTAFDTYNIAGEETYLGTRMADRGSVEAYEAIVHGMHGKISTMGRKLERALLSVQRRDWMTNTEQGSLDPKRLVQASIGKPNVFRLRDDRKELDTAVSVMIDLSGSMSGYPAELAMQVAVAMSLVMEKVGVSYEVLGFNNTSPSRSRSASQAAIDEYINSMHEARSNPETHGRYSRFEPLNIYEFKGFEKRLVQERIAMSSISNMSGGNNSDVDAVKVSHAHLRARQERKKVLFVLSDGYPACTHSFDSKHQHQHLRNRIEQVGKEGIECVGIGIGSEAVQQFYPKYVVVNELEDLPKAAFDQIAKILVGERFKVDNSELMKANTAR